MSTKKADFEASITATFGGQEVEGVVGIDPAPLVVYLLRVLLNRSAFSREHVQKVEAVSRLILQHWDRAENIEQLKADLGLMAPKRRHSSLRVKRETSIAAAIFRAALAGESDPKVAAGETLEAEPHQVQRAWKAWKHFFLPILEWNASQSVDPKRERILAAIKRLR